MCAPVLTGTLPRPRVDDATGAGRAPRLVAARPHRQRCPRTGRGGSEDILNRPKSNWTPCKVPESAPDSAYIVGGTTLRTHARRGIFSLCTAELAHAYGTPLVTGASSGRPGRCPVVALYCCGRISTRSVLVPSCLSRVTCSAGIFEGVRHGDLRR